MTELLYFFYKKTDVYKRQDWLVYWGKRNKVFKNNPSHVKHFKLSSENKGIIAGHTNAGIGCFIKYSFTVEKPIFSNFSILTRPDYPYILFHLSLIHI